MTSRAPKFSTAATTAATADGPPAATTAAPRGVSDIPRKEPRNNGQNGTTDGYSLESLLTNRVDPDQDLTPRNFAIPRYLAEALRVHSLSTRRPQQAIVADALRALLPDGLVDTARRMAE